MDKYTLEFCRWLQENFDELISEPDKKEMIRQAHADAATERQFKPNTTERKNFVHGRTKAKGA